MHIEEGKPLAYVTVPKDLTVVKTKILFGLTKRQLICFSSGALVGLPLFFLVKSFTSVSIASLCMILVMLPFFMLAMYQRNGVPMEKLVANIIRVYFVKPKRRMYETNNFYSAVERQYLLDEEVRRITDNAKNQSLTDSSSQIRSGVFALKRGGDSFEKEQAIPKAAKADR